MDNERAQAARDGLTMSLCLRLCFKGLFLCLKGMSHPHCERLSLCLSGFGKGADMGLCLNSMSQESYVSNVRHKNET